MNEIRTYLLTKFEKEIILSKSVLSGQDDLEKNIHIASDFPNTEFSSEERRFIFDTMYPTQSLKMFIYTAFKFDNLYLYSFIVEGLGYKKGNEIINSVICQRKDLEEFKPTKIVDWLIDKDYSDNNKNITVEYLSGSLLFVVQDDKKKSKKLFSNKYFSTNTLEMYKCLLNTQNIEIIDGVMSKHLKRYKKKDYSYNNDIILTQIDKNNNEQLYSYYKNAPLENLKFYKNIYSYLLKQNLENSLPEKNKISRIKI